MSWRQAPGHQQPPSMMTRLWLQCYMNHTTQRTHRNTTLDQTFREKYGSRQSFRFFAVGRFVHYCDVIMGLMASQITSLDHSFKRRSKETLKLCLTDRCAGNSPVTGEFPAQMASNAENVSSWWHHQSATALRWTKNAYTYPCRKTILILLSRHLIYLIKNNRNLPPIFELK